MHYRRHMTMTGGLYPGESPAKYVALCHHADAAVSRAGFVALAAFVDHTGRPLRGGGRRLGRRRREPLERRRRRGGGLAPQDPRPKKKT